MGRRIGFGLLAAMLLAGHPLRAQWVVRDPSNLAQGIVNSTKQVVEASRNGSTLLQSFQQTVKIYEQSKKYYDALRSVHNLVISARRAQQTMLLVGDISDIYISNFRSMLDDTNYSAEELTAMAAGYTKLLSASADLLNDLKQIITPSGLSMTDKERLDIIDRIYYEMLEYRNLTEYYTRKKLKAAGLDAILSITGYTGAGGCEIYVANEDGEKLWKALWQEGSKEGLKNIGLGARDTLRLEMGFCLYGNDIDDTTSPIEAGLNWLTKFVDGKEFIDRKLMEEQKAGGLTRKLVGFKMIDRGIPRHGYQIASPEGDIIGQVTSGTMSPCLKQGIGMGYVKKEFAKVGTQIAIVIREKLMKAEVVKLPFIQQK